MTILVTRPDPGGSELCAYIKSNGGDAIHFPTIEFAPPLDGKAFQQAIETLDQQNWLIFVSPRAVYESIVPIRRAWPELPDTVKFAAVGAGTAKALTQAGYETTVYPDELWSSEGLLDLPEFVAVAGQHIMIVRGEGGREHLTTILTERGASVSALIAYQRVLPKIDVNHILDLFKQQHIDTIVCTSFDGVRNLKILAGESGWPFIKNVPVIVVSERIKRLAQDLDYQTIWVARNPSHEAIMEVLMQKKDAI